MSDIKNGPAEKEAPDSKKQIREKRKAISKWPVVLAVFCAAAAIFMLSYRYYAQEKARRLTEAGNAAKASGLAGTPSNGIIELDGKNTEETLQFARFSVLAWIRAGICSSKPRPE